MRHPVIRTLTCLIVTGSAVCPLHAWKSKVVISRSPHKLHTERALQILRKKAARTQAPTTEWDRYADKLIESAATLTGDGNAHGNAVLRDQRIPDDRNSTGELTPEELA